MATGEQLKCETALTLCSGKKVPHRQILWLDSRVICRSKLLCSLWNKHGLSWSVWRVWNGMLGHPSGVEFPYGEDCPSLTKGQFSGCNLPREGTACSLGMNKAHAVFVQHHVPVPSSVEGTRTYRRRIVSKIPRASIVWPFCECSGFKHWVERGKKNEEPGIFFHTGQKEALSL